MKRIPPTVLFLAIGAALAIIFETLWLSSRTLGASVESMAYAAEGILGTTFSVTGGAIFVRANPFRAVSIFLIFAWPQCVPVLNSMATNGAIDGSMVLWLGVSGEALALGLAALIFSLTR